LYDSTDTATDSKGLSGPLKGALLRVVDALLDEVLRDLGRCFLRTFCAACYSCARDAVGNSAYLSATQHAH